MTTPQLTSYSMVKDLNFSSKIKNKTRVPTLTILIQLSARSSSQRNEARKTNKRHPSWKGRSKIISVCNDMTLCLENPRDSTNTHTQRKKKVGTNKIIHKSCRIPNHHTKVSCISIR